MANEKRFSADQEAIDQTSQSPKFLQHKAVRPPSDPLGSATRQERESHPHELFIGLRLSDAELHRVSDESQLILGARLLLRLLPEVEAEYAESACQTLFGAWARLQNGRLENQSHGIRGQFSAASQPNSNPLHQRSKAANDLVRSCARLILQSEPEEQSECFHEVVRNYLICVDPALWPLEDPRRCLTGEQKIDVQAGVEALRRDVESLSIGLSRAARIGPASIEEQAEILTLLTDPLWAENPPSWWRPDGGWTQLHTYLHERLGSLSFDVSGVSSSLVAASLATVIELRYPSLVKTDPQEIAGECKFDIDLASEIISRHGRDGVGVIKALAKDGVLPPVWSDIASEVEKKADITESEAERTEVRIGVIPETRHNAGRPPREVVQSASLYTTKEAAKRLGTSDSRVRQLCIKHNIGQIKGGGRLLSERDLDEVQRHRRPMGRPKNHGPHS